MTYESNGSLTTDKRDVAVSTSWDTQTEWEAYQAAQNVAIENGVVRLADVIPDSVVLKPESDDLTHFGGETGSWDINSNAPVYDGTYSLKSQSSTGEFIGSLSGLPNYPQVGKTHTVFVNPNSSSGSEDGNAFVAWANDSETERNNCYQAQINHDGDVFRLSLIENGSGSSIAEDLSPGVLANDFMAVEIFHEASGDLTAKLYDASSVGPDNYTDGTLLSELTSTDTTHITDGAYDNNGIGFVSFRDAAETYDLWRTN